MKFGNNVWLVVYGSIVAKGTATKKALFTSSSATPTPGIWNRIYLLGGSDTIKNSIIRYGIHDLYLYNSGTDIIDSCTIDSSLYYGIYIDTDNGTNIISNSTISGNASGMTIVNSKANIVASVITNNNGHGMFVFSSKPYISSSRIQNNSGNGVYVSGTTAMPFFSPDGLAPGYNTLKLNTNPQLKNYNAGAYLGELTSYKQCICPELSTMDFKSIQSSCPPSCFNQTVYVIHAGYNNIYTSSTASGMLVTNNTSTTINARYNYWYTPGTSSIVGAVDTTSRLSDSVFTPVVNVLAFVDNGGEYLRRDRIAERPILQSYVNQTPSPVPQDSVSVVAWLNSLKETVETNPDSAAMALHLLSAFVGPGGAYEAALDTPWEDYLSHMQSVTPSHSLKLLVGVYRVQAKIDRHQFARAIALSDAELSGNSVTQSIWLYHKIEQVIAYLGMGKKVSALTVSQNLHQRRSGLVDPLLLTMVDRLIADHPDGVFMDSSTIISTPVGSVQPVALSQAPIVYALSQNYPNPFNPTTTIEYLLPAKSMVSLKVFNLLGQEIAKLVDESESSGPKSIAFDANSLSSGMYFYRLRAQEIVDASSGTSGQTYTLVKKMMLVK